MSTTLVPLDLVDLGLVRHFLGEQVESIWEECVVALSVAATRIALARLSSLLLLQQRSPAGSAPKLVEMPRGDNIRALEWIEAAADHQSHADAKLLLLVGCASGYLRAFTPDGLGLWNVRPSAAPLVSVRAHTSGPSPDVLLVFEGGIIGHASASWLTVALSSSTDTQSAARTQRAIAAGINVVSMDETPSQCAAVLSCGPLPSLPLDVPDRLIGAVDQPLCFIAAGRGRWPRLPHTHPCTPASSSAVVCSTSPA